MDVNVNIDQMNQFKKLMLRRNQKRKLISLIKLRKQRNQIIKLNKNKYKRLILVKNRENLLKVMLPLKFKEIGKNIKLNKSIRRKKKTNKRKQVQIWNKSILKKKLQMLNLLLILTELKLHHISIDNFILRF